MSYRSPVEILHSIGRRADRPWRRYALALHEAREHGRTWPDYAFAPHGTGASVPGRPADAKPGWAQNLDALAAWRPTQGVYRFHPTLLEALWQTPIKGELPVELLRRLPEWCVYVETPGRLAGTGMPIRGFFAHVIHRDDLDRDELHLILDFGLPIERGVMLHPEILPLVGSLEEALRCASVEASRTPDALPDWFLDQIVRHKMGYAPLVSLLLYLCSEDAELRDATGEKARPTRPRLLRSRRRGKIRRHPSASKVVVLETAFRLGERLDNAMSTVDHSANRTVRPHVRRAHWHTYWRGKLGDRRRILRWISPLLINADEVASSTVRRVDG